MVTWAVWYSPTPNPKCRPLEVSPFPSCAHTPCKHQRALKLIKGGCEDPVEWQGVYVEGRGKINTLHEVG